MTAHMSTRMDTTAASPGFSLPVPDISAWRAGNTGTEGVWHFDSGQPGRHVMISALVHGNELCGAWALKGLLEAGVRPEQGGLTPEAAVDWVKQFKKDGRYQRDVY